EHARSGDSKIYAGYMSVAAFAGISLGDWAEDALESFLAKKPEMVLDCHELKN
ncbi:hypothetical protein A2U01_0005264, partial [Trifolium medium]|nr:hypothetical protein [Trifolium medium]